MKSDYWTGKHPHPLLEEFLKEGRMAFSEDYHEALTQARDDFEVCVVCGKRTTRERGITVLFGLGGSALIHPEDNEEAMVEDSGYLGHFMVGPECGKKIPEEYRVKKLPEYLCK